MIRLLRNPAAAYVLLPLAAASWAGNHVIARSVAGVVPPASLCAVRWLLVALLIWLVARPQINQDLPRMFARPGLLVLLGITGAGGFGTLQYVALQHTTALNMGVVGSVGPAFIILASFLLFGDRVSVMQLTGVGISFVGVLAIVTRLHPELIGSLSFNVGDLIIIANMSMWAIYSACLRLRPQIAPISFMFAISAVAFLTNVPFALWEHARGFTLQMRGETFLAVFYTVFFTTLLSYISWNKGVELIGAARASAFMHTTAIFSGIFATTLIGERIELYHVVGFLLILGGVTLAARPSPQTNAAAEKARSGQP